MLQAFSLQNWIELTIGIFILVPGYIYFKNYRRTGVLEFLYFGMLTIIIAVNEFTLIYRDLTGLTILTEQVVDTCINLIILTISLHAIRVKWEHPPVVILGITLGWFLLLQSFVFFYQIIAIPDEAFHLFIDMKQLGDFTVGAGIILGDTIIHANGYIFLVYLYGFYVSLLYLYVYGTTKPFVENVRINFARKLWMTADFFLFLFSTLKKPVLAFSLEKASH